MLIGGSGGDVCRDVVADVGRDVGRPRLMLSGDSSGGVVGRDTFMLIGGSSGGDAGRDVGRQRFRGDSRLPGGSDNVAPLPGGTGRASDATLCCTQCEVRLGVVRLFLGRGLSPRMGWSCDCLVCHPALGGVIIAACRALMPAPRASMRSTLDAIS